MSLIEVAARRLASGPSHTLELARDVLELSGHPGAASKAVFTLLGRDPRFHVDPDGYWTLVAEREPPGVPLSRLRYAVVDVETTGGLGGRGDRVTEVAVVQVDEASIGPCFESLVNPGRLIPPRIQGFTGITDEMVSVAPYFEGLADEVLHRIGDRIFVAHNERFDWSMMRRELLSAGREVPVVERLCTVRMGRLLVPRLGSYGLDRLTAHFGIRVERRHRAFDDALATARLLLHLLAAAEERGIHDLAALREALRRRGRRHRGRTPNRGIRS